MPNIAEGVGTPPGSAFLMPPAARRGTMAEACLPGVMAGRSPGSKDPHFLAFHQDDALVAGRFQLALQRPEVGLRLG
jgi:hypothetical protein